MPSQTEVVMITRNIVLILLGTFALMVTGCADKQEEADRLQEEVQSLEGDSAVDTMAESTQPVDPTDSLAADGSAIPS